MEQFHFLLHEDSKQVDPGRTIVVHTTELLLLNPLRVYSSI